ncbi:MAG: radical SAM protein [Candidatus Cloacimonadaceae bacterium]
MKKPDKSLIYPLFIPMQGCPARCLYCDQQKISGAAPFDLEKAIAEVRAFIRRNPSKTKEIALYGGSFTGLDLSRQQEILSALSTELDVRSSLRISTHPLYIDTQILSLLKSYRVETIELGIQDFHDKVLQATGRGYNSAQAQKAISLVQKAGFRLGIQLMPGLPGADNESLQENFRQLAQIKPRYLRLYPTVVIRGTPLAELYLQHCYKPLSLQAAIGICARYHALCQKIGTRIIKYGLPSNIAKTDVIAGAYHPAFGELVLQRILYDRLQTNPDSDQELDAKQKQLLAAHGGKYLQALPACASPLRK